MRVAICSAGELYGGVEQFIYMYAQHLQSLDHVGVIVILFYEGVLRNRLKDAGVETYLVKSRSKFGLHAVSAVADILRRCQIDVIHTHGYKANVICALAARRTGAAIVKTEHGIVEPPLRLDLSILKAHFYRTADQLVTLALVRHIVYVTHDLERRFRFLHSSKRRIVIHNAIAPIAVPSHRNAGALNRNGFNIGIVGRVDKVKGHAFLMKAVEELSGFDDLRVHILGSGPLERELKDYCVSRRIDSKVTFWGFCEDIHRRMSDLDVLVMPSLYEGLPYTVLEAMYLRVPIVASAVGGLREVLRNGENALLVAPADHRALAQAIRRLHRDPELRRKIADKAFCDVTSQFMMGEMARKYLAVYRAAMAYAGTG